MVTQLPTATFRGVTDVICGAARTKFVALVAVPKKLLVTVILPVTLPEGTTASISVELTTETLSDAMPLNRTMLTVVKSVPVMVTRVPATPCAGENDVIESAA